MDQICYNILRELTKKSIHLRELAKVIKTNHMTVLRKLNQLYKENVVDYRMEGKNKVFFLKITLEAKQYVYMYEQKKVILVIKKYPRLRRIIEQVRRHPEIRLAIIFGSYANDTATSSSDMDLYIETKNKNIKEELIQLDSKLSIKLGVLAGLPLAKEIEKNHLIIKGVEEFYEKPSVFTQTA